MGGAPSSAFVSQSPSVITVQSQELTKSDRNTSGNNTEFIFPGISLNQSILCLDEFKSKHTGEKLYRWRDSTIQDFLSTHTVRIRFKGWSEMHDIKLDLEHEWIRLSPFEIISDEQMMQGIQLNKRQTEIVYDFLSTGNLTIEDDSSISNDDNTSNNPYFPGQKVLLFPSL